MSTKSNILCLIDRLQLSRVTFGGVKQEGAKYLLEAFTQLGKDGHDERSTDS
jgi:hypothetical protein